MLHFTPHIKPSKGYMRAYNGRGDIDDRREFNLNCTLPRELGIWYKADRFALYMGIAPESYRVSYVWLLGI
jgi:hypothetical protein